MAWATAYGGDDGAYGMAAVSDGYVMLGDISGSMSNGSEDFYLVKADLKGDPVWTKTFGGKAWDVGKSIAAVSDGFILGGVTQSFGSSDRGDMYLVKTDLNGNLVWQKNFGGSGTEYGYGVAAVRDGYLIVGNTENSFGNTNDLVYLVKTDLDGNLVWQKTYGGRSWEGRYVLPVSDGYLITGKTWEDGVFLLKTDLDGNQVWQSNMGGIDAEGKSIVAASDGYVVTGNGYSLTSSYNDIFLAKTDRNGNLIWKKFFGGKGFDDAYAVVALPDGYALTGSTSSFSADGDRYVYLIRTDLNGNMTWNATYGKGGFDEGHAIVAVGDAYVIAGRTNTLGYGACLIKTNSESSPNATPATPVPSPGTSSPGVTKTLVTPLASAPDLTWEKTLGGTDFEWGNGLVPVSDGFVIAGTASPKENNTLKLLMVKADRNGNMVWNKTYSVTGGDRGFSIAAVSDGFVITGESNVTQGVFGGGVLLKTDFNGNMLWSKTFASDLGWDDVIGGIAVSDGFVMVGCTDLWGQLPLDHNTNKYERTLLLIKTDRKGNLAWMKEIGGLNPLRGLAVAAAPDGYVATGDTSSSGMIIINEDSGQRWPNPRPNKNIDVCLVKTDLNGEVVWQKTYGGAGTDTGFAVAVVKDGYVIAGETNSTANSNRGVYLIKTDLKGNMVWNRTFDRFEISGGKSIVALDDGYVIAGTAYSKNSDVYLLRTDLDGNLVWDATFGGNGSQEGAAVVKVSDGFAIAGETLSYDNSGDHNSDVYLLKTGAGGTAGSASGSGSGCCSICPLAFLILLIGATAPGFLYRMRQGKK